MSWVWLVPLALAGLAAAAAAVLAASAGRELEQLRLARARIDQVRPMLNGARQR